MKIGCASAREIATEASLADIKKRPGKGPFGGTIEMTWRTPGPSLRMNLSPIRFTNVYPGGAYLAVGEKR